MIVKKTMKDYGFTRVHIIFMLIYAIFVLILIFIFIFVGVAAFTGQGTLGAIVNSILAAGSGEQVICALRLPEKPASHGNCNPGLFNFFLNFSEGIALNLRENDKEEVPVTVKIGDEEYTEGDGGKA